MLSWLPERLPRAFEVKHAEALRKHFVVGAERGAHGDGVILKERGCGGVVVREQYIEFGAIRFQ